MTTTTKKKQERRESREWTTTKRRQSPATRSPRRLKTGGVNQVKKNTPYLCGCISLSLCLSRVSSQWNVLPVFHEVAALESRPSSLNIRPPAPTPALQVSGCVEELLRCNKRLQIGWKSSREQKKNRLFVCCASILTIDRFGHPLSNNRKSDTSKTYRNFRSTKKKEEKRNLLKNSLIHWWWSICFYWYHCHEHRTQPTVSVSLFQEEIRGIKSNQKPQWKSYTISDNKRTTKWKRSLSSASTSQLKFHFPTRSIPPLLPPSQ